jgi:hypothetical protein
MTATHREPMTMLRQRDAGQDQAGGAAGHTSNPLRREPHDTPGTGAQPPAPTERAGVVGLGVPQRGGPSFAAALVDIVPVLPTIGAIATVFAYVGVGGPDGLVGFASLLHLYPLIAGGVVALTVGVVMAGCHHPFFTAPDQAHPQSFAELRQRLDSLTSQLRVLGGCPPADQTPSQALAVGEAAAHQRALEHDLARGGPHWIIGTGYVDALTRLHRAEESLILVQPAEDIVAGALFDELRLAGSTMPERERLLGKLRAAVRVLSPSAAAYLSEPVTPTRTKPVDLQAVASGNQGAHATPVTTSPCTLQATQARMVLQGVRRAINDFRDESRARLVRSRCRLLGTMTFTGIITYVLLAFAVTVSPHSTGLGSNPIAAAAAIYLVGAVVGLFNRLYMESGDEAAGEDYGLSKARLLLTPMLSGLAAVGGVMIVGMLSGIVDVTAFTPAATVAVTPTPTAITTPGTLTDAATIAAAQGAHARDAVLSLSDIYNLEKYPFGLVLASIFGLMPKSFLERLQRASEQSKLDLRSTAATRQ